MQLVRALAALSVAALSAAQSFNNNSAQYVQPIGSPGFYHGLSNSSVTFDQHSILLDGKRLVVFSGEFHPFRLPAPELWYDILEKFKASGFNAVSVYWHWGLSAPNAAEVRFTQHNDLAAFFTAAQEVGLLVVVRPGPYVNAETAAGGIPGWTTNIPALARTNATGYRTAWLPYISAFAQATAPFQYPHGPVIAIQSENEFETSATAHITGLSEHMQDIENVLRANGMNKVPIIHNDRGPNGQYAKAGLGKVDLYGWDGYPLGFDCNSPSVWTELSTPTTPTNRSTPRSRSLCSSGKAVRSTIGPGPATKCSLLVNEQFANVYYKNNYAAGAALQNLYMTYGGTNWGNMHCTTIYSSYDYGGAIAEDRTSRPKLAELKLQSYFLHASPDYLLVGRVGAGTTFSTSPDIYTTNLRSPSSNANFYVVRQLTNTKVTDTDFTLSVNTTALGLITIPTAGNLTLAGRETKIVVTNYPFGQGMLVFSTAEVMTWATFDGVDTIVLYALAGQYVEISVLNPKHQTIRTSGSNTISAKGGKGLVTISGTPSGLTFITFGTNKLIVGDKQTVSAFWAPRLSTGSAQYDLTPETPSVLVSGPYLVRSATAAGSVLALTGDLNATTQLNVWGPQKFTSITWNGTPVPTTSGIGSSLQATLGFPQSLPSAQIPVLQDLAWSCADSLPELQPGFDDSQWVVANKTSTQRPLKPTAGKYVLYAGEYGFHAGQWVWRGHFNGNATGVQLSIQGGFSFGYSVFLNSHFLGSGQGSSIDQRGVDLLSPTFNFTAGMLIPAGNVLTVIHDSTGLNEDYNVNDEHKTPRGIRGYTLLSTTGNDFTQWKVAGNIGGENASDYVRGPYNEGGWWFERVGAHLPGYNASSWQSCTPYQGRSTAGVTAYRTTFTLDLPAGSDIPLAFDLALDSAAPYRSMIYVNGWQFGRFASSLGPQVSYPVPEGILNHHGPNEILITLWALNASGAKMSTLSLNKRASIASSKRASVTVVPAPGWAELRG
ncbi:unnamed protein product [Mycena citricolor]|uniref:beta-galactosidase n=1 Tax=Mycena citricolor TaxID=2018698 RepID=A0AAD2K3E0_9AGAR|nr:unnamed protein product [Mycena citricolor]